MTRLTQSLAMFLMLYHRDLYCPITFGHAELLTDEIQREYYEWLHTEEGRSYLKGGSNYDEEYAQRLGI